MTAPRRACRSRSSASRPGTERWESAQVPIAAALFLVAVCLVDPPDGWSDPSPWWREVRTGIGYSGLVCFPAAAWFLLSALANLARARLAVGWPETEAPILPSGTVPVYAGSGILLTSPKVTYTYVVGGTTYRNDNVQFGKAAYATDARARAIADRFAARQVVPIRYDPADPSVAALELRGDMARRQLLTSAAMAFLPFALGLLGAWLNTR